MSISTVAPARIRRGVTAKWTLLRSDYPPADGWILTYQFHTALAFHTVVATDNGDGSFLITIPASGAGVSTDDFAVGHFTYGATVALGGEVYEVDSGQLEVLPAFGAAAEGRSIAKQMVDAIEAKLLSMATSGVFVAGVVSVSTPGGSRSTSFQSPAELNMALSHWRAIYENELVEERLGKGLGTGRKIRTRFGR